MVIEDAKEPTKLVSKVLDRIGIPYSHMIAPMPDKYKHNKVKPRGVANRNRGLKWIRENASEGVFYFADDDNTYDIAIFDQVSLVQHPLNNYLLLFISDALYEKSVYVASWINNKIWC